MAEATLHFKYITNYNRKNEYMCVFVYMYIQVNPFAVYLETNGHCTSTIIQLKKKHELLNFCKISNQAFWDYEAVVVTVYFTKCMTLLGISSLNNIRADIFPKPQWLSLHFSPLIMFS